MMTSNNPAPAGMLPFQHSSFNNLTTITCNFLNLSHMLNAVNSAKLLLNIRGFIETENNNKRINKIFHPFNTSFAGIQWTKKNMRKNQFNCIKSYPIVENNKKNIYTKNAIKK